MKGYLGVPGALLSVPYVGTESASPARQVSSKQTLSGRTFALLGAVTRRTWQVGITGLRPFEVAAVVSAAEGPQQGLRWISPVMQTQNMLTARQSLLAADFEAAGLAQGTGVVTDAAGVPILGREALTGVSGSLTVQTPVPAEEPVCASAWVQGGTLTLSFKDAAGAAVGTTYTTDAGADLRRCAVFGPSPAGAAYAVLTVLTASKVARPCFTLTPWLMPFSSGKGAAAVILTGPEETYKTAWRDASSPSRTDVTFTVMEVG